jgi:hypothetical protein
MFSTGGRRGETEFRVESLRYLGNCPYRAGCRNRWLRESAGAETLTNCGLAETAGLTVDPAAPCLDSVLKHSSPLPEPRSFSS